MAVNSITFGGVNSADFGIYISGEGVFNAPKRDVEMVSIPGRDGALALDKGRFENIEVTYPAFNFEPNDYESFAQNLSDFRNAICSLRGYQRLTDTFHPDEYRMATYIGGLEIKPIKYNTASEFSIVFDCKPQRWLTSGEAAVTVASGDTLTNPTLFESSPLLEVEGYGTIGFNGYEIELNEAPMGDVIVADAFSKATNFYNGTSGTSNAEVLKSFSPSSFNMGDTLSMGDVYITGNFKIDNFSKIVYSSIDPEAIPPKITRSADGNIGMEFVVSGGSASTGTTQKTDISFPVYNFQIRTTDGDTTATISVRLSTYYNSSNEHQYVSVSIISHSPIKGVSATVSVPSVYVNSTISLLGHPTYIDCDLGEAYKYEGTSVISLNRYIDLGSDLPKLASGENEVTFDNTVTELKVHPRWWKI